MERSVISSASDCRKTKEYYCFISENTYTVLRTRNKIYFEKRLSSYNRKRLLM